jgi:hypothetical protein
MVLQALRRRLADERSAATAALLRALSAAYPEQDAATLAGAADALVAPLAGSDLILSLAADARELLPPDFANMRPKAVLKAFAAAREEKGLSTAGIALHGGAGGGKKAAGGAGRG